MLGGFFGMAFGLGAFISCYGVRYGDEKLIAILWAVMTKYRTPDRKPLKLS